ncbi:hypothetical protein KPH14_005762 [Odynerus spinipes]|uniref:Uncharacterized protein n=1 Tax=Odynerus spinipes TaxID=1348599 RepID=A0AAD9RB75_9HYME|nr:hypothetical protein KPH14_005762 [Odynerus spinipes]
MKSRILSLLRNGAIAKHCCVYRRNDTAVFNAFTASVHYKTKKILVELPTVRNNCTIFIVNYLFMHLRFSYFHLIKEGMRIEVKEKKSLYCYIFGFRRCVTQKKSTHRERKQKLLIADIFLSNYRYELSRK